jgi:hypothetical protein
MVDKQDRSEHAHVYTLQGQGVGLKHITRIFMGLLNPPGLLKSGMKFMMSKVGHAQTVFTLVVVT